MTVYAINNKNPAVAVMDRSSVWFKLTLTVTEISVNWKIMYQLTVTVTVTEKCSINCN